MTKNWDKGIFFFLVLLTSISCFSQEPDYPFTNGEYCKYGVYYNWHFIWVYSGNVEFTTSKEQLNEQNVWHFKAIGGTFMPYDLLYKVRDTFEVYTSIKPFLPIRFKRVVHHAQKNSSHQYVFDHQKEVVYSCIKRNKQNLFRDTLILGKNTHDLLSSAYFFRGFNFSKFEKGKRFYYRMLVDNEIEDLYFRYLGTEVVTTRNKKKFRCHKLSVQLMEGDFFPEGEYMKVWITDDMNKIPVQVETEIKVGSVKVVLLDIKSFKYPLNSQIN